MVLPGCSIVLLGFTGLLSSCTSFYRVLLGFTGFFN